MGTWNLIGRTLSYRVDMSDVGCACNAAFYFVTMPAAERTQCNDYYCDANAVCGSNCAEFDLQEGNTHTWATTSHHAYDGKGCERHAANYGPGKTVDPARGTMYVSTTFHGSGSNLERIETTITQGAGEVTMVHDKSCGLNLEE